MKISAEADLRSMDMISEDDIQVEIQSEAGFRDKFKLYITDKNNGKIIVRVCKLGAADIILDSSTGMSFTISGRHHEDSST